MPRTQMTPESLRLYDILGKPDLSPTDAQFVLEQIETNPKLLQKPPFSMQGENIDYWRQRAGNVVEEYRMMPPQSGDLTTLLGHSTETGRTRQELELEMRQAIRSGDLPYRPSPQQVEGYFKQKYDIERYQEYRKTAQEEGPMSMAAWARQPEQAKLRLLGALRVADLPKDPETKKTIIPEGYFRRQDDRANVYPIEAVTRGAYLGQAEGGGIISTFSQEKLTGVGKRIQNLGVHEMATLTGLGPQQEAFMKPGPGAGRPDRFQTINAALFVGGTPFVSGQAGISSSVGQATYRTTQEIYGRAGANLTQADLLPQVGQEFRPTQRFSFVEGLQAQRAPGRWGTKILGYEPISRPYTFTTPEGREVTREQTGFRAIMERRATAQDANLSSRAFMQKESLNVQDLSRVRGESGELLNPQMVGQMKDPWGTAYSYFMAQGPDKLRQALGGEYASGAKPLPASYGELGAQSYEAFLNMAQREKILQRVTVPVTVSQANMMALIDPKGEKYDPNTPITQQMLEGIPGVVPSSLTTVTDPATFGHAAMGPVQNRYNVDVTGMAMVGKFAMQASFNYPNKSTFINADEMQLMREQDPALAARFQQQGAGIQRAYQRNIMAGLATSGLTAAPANTRQMTQLEAQEMMARSVQAAREANPNMPIDQEIPREVLQKHFMQQFAGRAGAAAGEAPWASQFSSIPTPQGDITLAPGRDLQRFGAASKWLEGDVGRLPGSIMNVVEAYGAGDETRLQNAAMAHQAAIAETLGGEGARRGATGIYLGPQAAIGNMARGDLALHPGEVAGPGLWGQAVHATRQPSQGTESSRTMVGMVQSTLRALGLDEGSNYISTQAMQQSGGDYDTDRILLERVGAIRMVGKDQYVAANGQPITSPEEITRMAAEVRRMGAGDIMSEHLMAGNAPQTPEAAVAQMRGAMNTMSPQTFGQRLKASSDIYGVIGKYYKTFQGALATAGESGQLGMRGLFQRVHNIAQRPEMLPTPLRAIMAWTGYKPGTRSAARPVPQPGEQPYMPTMKGGPTQLRSDMLTQLMQAGLNPQQIGSILAREPGQIEGITGMAERYLDPAAGPGQRLQALQDIEQGTGTVGQFLTETPFGKMYGGGMIGQGLQEGMSLEQIAQRTALSEDTVLQMYELHQQQQQARQARAKPGSLRPGISETEANMERLQGLAQWTQAAGPQMGIEFAPLQQQQPKMFTRVPGGPPAAAAAPPQKPPPPPPDVTAAPMDEPELPQGWTKRNENRYLTLRNQAQNTPQLMTARDQIEFEELSQARTQAGLPTQAYQRPMPGMPGQEEFSRNMQASLESFQQKMQGVPAGVTAPAAGISAAETQSLLNDVAFPATQAQAQAQEQAWSQLRGATPEQAAGKTPTGPAGAVGSEERKQWYEMTKARLNINRVKDIYNLSENLPSKMDRIRALQQQNKTITRQSHPDLYPLVQQAAKYHLDSDATRAIVGIIGGDYDPAADTWSGGDPDAPRAQIEAAREITKSGRLSLIRPEDTETAYKLAVESGAVEEPGAEMFGRREQLYNARMGNTMGRYANIGQGVAARQAGIQRGRTAGYYRAADDTDSAFAYASRVREMGGQGRDIVTRYAELSGQYQTGTAAQQRALAPEMNQLAEAFKLIRTEAEPLIASIKEQRETIVESNKAIREELGVARQRMTSTQGMLGQNRMFEASLRGVDSPAAQEIRERLTTQRYRLQGQLGRERGEVAGLEGQLGEGLGQLEALEAPAIRGAGVRGVKPPASFGQEAMGIVGKNLDPASMFYRSQMLMQGYYMLGRPLLAARESYLGEQQNRAQMQFAMGGGIMGDPQLQELQMQQAASTDAFNTFGYGVQQTTGSWLQSLAGVQQGGKGIIESAGRVAPYAIAGGMGAFAAKSLGLPQLAGAAMRHTGLSMLPSAPTTTLQGVGSLPATALARGGWGGALGRLGSFGGALNVASLATAGADLGTAGVDIITGQEGEGQRRLNMLGGLGAYGLGLGTEYAQAVATQKDTVGDTLRKGVAGFGALASWGASSITGRDPNPAGQFWSRFGNEGVMSAFTGGTVGAPGTFLGGAAPETKPSGPIDVNIANYDDMGEWLQAATAKTRGDTETARISRDQAYQILGAFGEATGVTEAQMRQGGRPAQLAEDLTQRALNVNMDPAAMARYMQQVPGAFGTMAGGARSMQLQEQMLQNFTSPTALQNWMQSGQAVSPVLQRAGGGMWGNDQIMGNVQKAYTQINQDEGEFAAQRMLSRLTGGNAYDYSDLVRRAGMPEMAMMDEAGRPRFQQENYDIEDRQRQYQVQTQLGTQTGGVWSGGRDEQQITFMEQRFELENEFWDFRREAQQRDYQMSQRQQDLSIRQYEYQLDREEELAQRRDEHQEKQFELQQRQFEMQSRWAAEDLDIREQKMETQRAWQIEDFGRNREQFEVQAGWQQEDFQRALRYSSGRQRLDIMREMERAGIKQEWGRESMDIQEGRAETQYGWAKEDLDRDRERLEERNNLERERMELSRSYWEQEKSMSEQDRQMRKAFGEEQLQLMKDRQADSKWQFENSQKLDIMQKAQNDRETAARIQWQKMDLEEARRRAVENEKQIVWQRQMTEAQQRYNMIMAIGYDDAIKKQREILQIQQQMVQEARNYNNLVNGSSGGGTGTGTGGSGGGGSNRNGAPARMPEETPQLAEGGPVAKTGGAIVHEGEYVVPAQGTLVSKDERVVELLQLLVAEMARAANGIEKMPPGTNPNIALADLFNQSYRVR